MTNANNGPRNIFRSRRFLTNVLLGGAVVASLVAIGLHRPRAASVPPTRTDTPAPRSTGPIQTLSVEMSQDPRPVEIAQPQRPRVEMVFALDTTGSMGGLIEGAKRKIWSLASFVARGQPTPDLRIGLIGYRDRGDAYVTRVFDLDDDLDKVFARLQRFHADGGGDTPEHVSRALHEAVHKMSWSQETGVVKVIYLVGDAPPHTDYDDGYDFERSARAAGRKNIQVHTIRCGSDTDTARTWKRIAMLGRGEFLTIGQDGGMKAARTPYDDELARLHDELSRTSAGYGAGAASVAAATTIALAAAPEVKADRASFMAAKGKAAGGGGDLADDWKNGKLDLATMAAKDLPADLRGKNRDEQETTLRGTLEKRQKLSTEIDALVKKRADHLASQAKSHPAEAGFDKAAKDTLRRSVAADPASGLKL